MRKKLSRIEEENETLQLQLNKMSTKAKVTLMFQRFSNAIWNEK